LARARARAERGAPARAPERGAMSAVALSASAGDAYGTLDASADAGADARDAAVNDDAHDATERGERSRRVTGCSRRTIGASTIAVAVGVMSACSVFGIGNRFDSLRASASVTKTIREYGGLIDELRWDDRRGFVVPRHSREHYNRNIIGKVNGAAEMIARTIETYMPGRTAKGEPPFDVLFTISDYLETSCVRRDARQSDKCHVDEWEPIFAFGTTLRDRKVLPSVIPAPLMSLNAVSRRVLQSMESGAFSRRWRSRWNETEYGQVLFDKSLLRADLGAESEYAWDKLIPKVVWRGTDYPFLGEQYDGFKKESCSSEDDCFLNDISRARDKEAKIQELLNDDKISPRLRTVLYSALHPDKVDAKFFSGKKGKYNGKREDLVSLRETLGRSLGVDVDGRMNSDEMGRYKYQIDIGGWGGTTWTGLIHKLSMPGVLLHHETSMVDSYYDSLVPWVHYVPVNENMDDLEEKIQWLMENDDKAREISENASKWVNEFATCRSISRHNYEKLAVPLQRLIDPERKFFIDFDVAHDFDQPVVVKASAHTFLDPLNQMDWKREKHSTP
jgi:hypothetical protein